MIAGTAVCSHWKPGKGQKLISSSIDNSPIQTNPRRARAIQPQKVFNFPPPVGAHASQSVGSFDQMQVGVEEDVGERQLQLESRDDENETVERVWGSNWGPLLEHASKVYGYAMMGAGVVAIFIVAISNVPFTKWTEVPSSVNGTNITVPKPEFDDSVWAGFLSGALSVLFAIRTALGCACYDPLAPFLPSFYAWSWAPIVFFICASVHAVLHGLTYALPLYLVSRAGRYYVQYWSHAQFGTHCGITWFAHGLSQTSS